MNDSVKLEVKKVTMNRQGGTFTIEADMLDMNELIPRTGRKFVLMSYEEYQDLTGVKPRVIMKPKKEKK